MKYIQTEFKDQIGTIVFNNDEKRNALSMDTLMELLAALDDFLQKKARVVIIRSNPGASVWSAGLRIDELPEPGKDPLPYNHPLETLMRKIEDFPAPVIAMIEGGVWGGGCDLAFTCDILIGSPSCSFAITPAKIGVPYNATGILHFLNMVEMNTAKEMFFTASPVMAHRAYDLGILNHIVEADEIKAFTYEMARKITFNSPLSIAVIKEQLNILGKARPINAEIYEKVNNLRQIAYNSHDFLEGKNSFLEKRHPKFKGE